MSNIIDKIQLSGVTYDIGGQGGSGVSVVEVTQAEYDALPSSAKTDTSKMYVITDAEAGDLTNYYTKTETNTLLGGKADTATTYTKDEVDNAITAATSTKQDTLVSSENIKTINNESILGSGNIDIQGGGGKAIEAGRGITVTTGETADTVSLNVINKYYGTVDLATSDRSVYNKSIMIGRSYIDNRELAIAIGTSQQNVAGGAKIYGTGGIGIGNSVVENSGYGIAIGHNSSAGTSDNQWACVAIGRYAESYGNYATALSRTKVNNESEFGCGKYNVSNTGSTDADKTLFSVGNGTSSSARHNAFEIRQNGDIYLTKDGQDVKLQDTITATAANTAALGGLSLVKLTQAQYDALATKDSNTLYVIVN